MSSVTEPCNPPNAGFTTYDLFDKVTKTVIADLKDGIPLFNRVLRDAGFYPTEEEARDVKVTKANGVIGVYRGPDIRVPDGYFILVETKNTKAEWMSTRVRKDTYNLEVSACQKISSQAEENQESLVYFAEAVKNYLIRFDNLQPLIIGTEPKIRAFNSWVPDGVEYNTQGAKTGVYRKATILYKLEVMNPYMVRATECL